MKEILKMIVSISIIAAILVGVVGIKVWRIRQFQKATGFGFVKAAFVLGK